MKLALAALLAALVVLPAASAQVADPSASVNLAPSVPSVTIPLGKSGTVNVTATVTFKNVVCSSAGTATVDVTVSEGAPVAGITAPATLSISVAVPANFPPPTGSAPSTEASGLGSSPFIITVASTAPAAHDHAYTLSGTVKSLPASCSNPGTFTSNTATANVAVKTGPAPTTAAPTSAATTPGGSATTSSETTKASFALPLPVILGALALAGLAGRRRE